jgi:hypothetical protein
VGHLSSIDTFVLYQDSNHEQSIEKDDVCPPLKRAKRFHSVTPIKWVNPAGPVDFNQSSHGSIPETDDVTIDHDALRDARKRFKRDQEVGHSRAPPPKSTSSASASKVSQAPPKSVKPAASTEPPKSVKPCEKVEKKVHPVSEVNLYFLESNPGETSIFYRNIGFSLILIYSFFLYLLFPHQLPLIAGVSSLYYFTMFAVIPFLRWSSGLTPFVAYSTQFTLVALYLSSLYCCVSLTFFCEDNPNHVMTIYAALCAVVGTIAVVFLTAKRRGAIYELYNCDVESVVIEPSYGITEDTFYMNTMPNYKSKRVVLVDMDGLQHLDNKYPYLEVGDHTFQLMCAELKTLPHLQNLESKPTLVHTALYHCQHVQSMSNYKLKAGVKRLVPIF